MVINFIDRLNSIETQRKLQGGLTYKQARQRKKLLEWHRREEVAKFVNSMFGNSSSNAYRY